MPLNKATIVALVVSALIFTSGGYVLGQKGALSLPGTTLGGMSFGDLLLLTNPITSFSGKIDKVEENSIIVSQKFTASTPFAPPAGPAEANRETSPIPTPVTKILSFRVLISENTQINRPAPYVPYIVKRNAPPPSTPKLTIKDLKVGTQVNVSTNQDLRTLKNNSFTATNIQLPSFPNALTGKIVKVSSDSLVFKAVPPPLESAEGNPQPSQEKTYTVLVTADTEISRNKPAEAGGATATAPTTPQVEEMALSDLKPDMQITVFTDVDVRVEVKFTALRIEPIIVTPPPQVVTTPPPQPTTVLPTAEPTKAPTATKTLPTLTPAAE